MDRVRRAKHEDVTTCDLSLVRGPSAARAVAAVTIGEVQPASGINGSFGHCKRGGRSPETSAYNQWLSERLADFVRCSVAPRLAERFEGHGRVVEVLASRVPPDAAWEPKFALLIDALRRSRFIPTLDGSLRCAVEARLLPESIPDPEEAALFLDLPKRTVLPSIQADPRVRSFLRERLSISSLSVRGAVETLSERRRDDAEGFYNFLVRWRDRHGRLNLDLVQALRELPCIRLQSGEWVSAAEQPYFPRERGQLEIPESIEVGIVGLPDIEAAEELYRLMEDLDVRPFQWAFVLPDYVLPKLTDPNVDSAARAGAFKVLSKYFKSTSAGDKGLREKIGQVLLPVRDVDGKVRRLEPANKCYFPAEWTGSTLLEDIYGPLHETEFLDVAPPPPGDRFNERFSFFQSLGVQDRPRLLTASASGKDAYPIKNRAMPPRHPHHTFTKHWTSWARLSEVKEQMLCDAGHAASQRLKTSFVLDRLDRILEDGSEKQRTALWKALARHWGDTYVGALESTVRCVHGNHAGERERPIPSLLAHMLRDIAWIPMQSTSESRVAMGRDIWRAGPDTPRHIRTIVPILSEALDSPESAEFARALGVVDATRLRSPELVELLNTLAERHATSVDEYGSLRGSSMGDGRLNGECSCRTTSYPSTSDRCCLRGKATDSFLLRIRWWPLTASSRRAGARSCLCMRATATRQGCRSA